MSRAKKAEITPQIDQAARDLITGATPKGLDQTLFVRAGAGAGKTHCIQERVRNLLLNEKKKLDPSQLAVITYTTKAAKELKERIRFELEAYAAEETDAARRERATRVLTELSRAKIGTVHSFCLDLLKEFPVEFLVDPGSNIADERQTNAIRAEVRRIFHEAEALEKPDFRATREARADLEALTDSSLSDDKLFSVLGKLYSNRELDPKPLKAAGGDTLETQRAKIRTTLGELLTDLFITIEKEIKDTDDKLYAKVPAIRKALIDLGVDETTPEPTEELIDALSPDKNLIPTSSGAKGSYKSKEFIPVFKERAKALKAQVARLYQLKLISAYNQILKIYPAYQAIYDQFKQEHGFLDFQDCLILTRNGLQSNAFLKAAIQDRFSVLIVDEYQDSDPLQSEILFHLGADSSDLTKDWKSQKIVPGKLLFMGDPKQSIYGFNRADIAIYLSVAEALKSSPGFGEPGLTTNFRSTEELITFINSAFGAIIKPHATHEHAAPNYSKMNSKTEKPTGGRVSVLDLQLGLPSDPPDKRVGVEDLRHREAWVVAEWIQNEIQSGKAKPGDFMILFRKSAGMPDYEKALGAHNIPVVNEKAKDFLQDPKTMALVAILGLLAYPWNTHALYAGLRSPWIGYSDKEARELMKKRTKDERIHLKLLAERDPRLNPLYQLSLSEYPLDGKLDEAFRLLGVYSLATATGDLDTLAAAPKLLEVLRLELGVTDYNNIAALESILGGVLKPPSRGRKDDDELEEASLILETIKPSKVRLMTVHGSKGLESKIVIIANPAAKPNERDSPIVERDGGTLTDITLSLRTKDIKMVNLPELSAQLARETVFAEEEEKRALYVAATRAENHLAIVRYAEQPLGPFLAPLEPHLSAIEPTSLTIAADFNEWFGPWATATKPTLASLTPEAHEGARRKHLASINERVKTTPAVTKLLETEAKVLFRNNPDGRERGKEFGTLLHGVMEWVCRRAGAGTRTTPKEAAGTLMRLNAEGLGFDDEEIAPIRLGVERFLASELYGKILAAKRVFTEVPFQLMGDTRGIIDLLYEDATGFHIID